jgi:PiT family inorganic phosphate transporter
VRATLIATSTGVSFAHGSNDGQKGIGLIMLILITVMPAQFALRATASPAEMQEAAAASAHIASELESLKASDTDLQRPSGVAAISSILGESAVAAPPPNVARVHALLTTVSQTYPGPFRDAGIALAKSEALRGEDRLKLRASLLAADQSLAKLEKDPALMTHPVWQKLSADRKKLRGMVDYAPTWVILAVALSIGIGTMIGWRRIVITLGSRIGKAHLTYAQGASAELVAMSMIGFSSMAGLPVSTTHVLSSGIAGTMVAGRAGLQSRTISHIALAWLLTLPVSMGMAAGFYLMYLRVFA